MQPFFTPQTPHHHHSASAYVASPSPALYIPTAAYPSPQQYSNYDTYQPVFVPPHPGTPMQLVQPQQAVEYIPHRVFVGGFTTSTSEQDLRAHFEQFFHVREAKVVRGQEGSSRGYGFVTFDTEEEANAVRDMSPKKLELNGRRLNIGPAMRRLSTPRYAPEYTIATPTGQLLQAPGPTFAFPQPTLYYAASPVASSPSMPVAMSPHQLQPLCPPPPPYVHCSQQPVTPSTHQQQSHFHDSVNNDNNPQPVSSPY